MIFLTSTGFSNKNVYDKFIELAKPNSSDRVAIITTAAEEKEKNEFSQFAYQQLEKMDYQNIDFFDVEFQNPEELKKYDVLYICGGNTFYLLKHLKESGADKIISDIVKQGIIYVGVSAGSIVIGPNINIANEVEPDPNDVGLSDLTGLGVIDLIVCPHFTEQSEDEVEKFEKKYGVSVERLTDEQAIAFKDDEIIRIG